MHLNPGQMRALLDGEAVQGLIIQRARKHLAECKECQAKYEQVARQAQQVRGHLAFLEVPDPNEQLEQEALNATLTSWQERRALGKFKQSVLLEKETSSMNNVLQRLFRSRLAWASLAVIIALIMVLSLPAGRSMAGQFLGLFRVQQITVLPVDPTGISLLTGDSTLGRQITQLVSSSMTVEQAAGKPQAVADANQASQLAGFQVRLPAQPTPDQLVVRDREAFKLTINRQQAQALIDEAGRQDLVLPESLDGATIQVNIPAGIGAAYGTCPSLTAVDEPTGAGPVGSPGRRYTDCMMLAELPSPTVDTPPNVDLEQLAILGLQFTGMTPEQAQAYAANVDWTTSLVVPIPMNAAKYSQINVDGVTGTLIQRPPDDAPQFALIWVKNGVIYTIGGLGSDTSRAIQLANSLP